MKIDKEFQLFKKDYEKGEKKIVEEFINKIEQKDILETDFFSQFLKEKIEVLKVERKSVLILDDIDRIDPEHIFRVLNVLSAYFEREDRNKFGFDKIIIVADYDNIEKIFYHKYGIGTDSSGYLDKFFSVSPYRFDNKKAVIGMVDRIVSSINNEDKNLENAVNEGGYIKLFLEHIFVKTISINKGNLRQLLKVVKYQLTPLKSGSFYDGDFTDDFQKYFNIAIRVLILCFSSKEEFVNKISLIRDSSVNVESRMPFDNYIKKMIEVLGIQVFQTDRDQTFTWGGYTIESKNDNRLIVRKGTIENLFYDLLVEYVESEKFN